MGVAGRDGQERAAAGIPEALIRYSVGVENFEDLIADLRQALGSIGDKTMRYMP